MPVFMNRNTSPTRPLTDEQLTKVVTNTPLNQYPEQELACFKELYANYNQLDPAQIEVANGADEWLQKLMIQFGQEGVLTIDPDFFMYQDYAKQIGRPFWQVGSDSDFNFDLTTVLAAIQKHQPSLLIVSNPQNPTGTQFEAEFLQTLADAMEAIGGYFVIDEAYIEFGDEYIRPTNQNVIFVRTLSKIYGLAGLRIGIAIAKGETYQKMVQINHPYPINHLVLNIANTLFENEEQLSQWISYQKECQQALIAAFETVNDLVTVKPTKGNFLLTYGPKSRDLSAYLKQHGFIARIYDEAHLSQVVRYSILDLDQYETFTLLLKEWRNQLK